MDFLIQQHANCTVITTNVEKLNAINAPDLKSELLLLNKKSINNIVIDLSNTKYCDSSGLSSVLIANRLCKDSNGKLLLCGLQPAVAKMISIAQLDRVLAISLTLDDAMAQITK